MNIYIIRHGNPDYEHDSLTELGRKEVRLLGEKYRDFPIDKIYVSSQGRAMETAAPIIDSHKIRPIYCDWAREDLGGQYYGGINPDTGTWTWFFFMNKYKKIFRSEEMKKYGSDWLKHPDVANTTMPEGFRRMAESVDAFMLEQGYQHDRANHCYVSVGDHPDNVFIVAHGGFELSFLSNLCDIPYPEFTTTHMHPDCTAVTRVTMVQGDRVEYPYIVLYNDISHLK